MSTINREVAKRFVIALVKMRSNNRIFAEHLVSEEEYPTIHIGTVVLSADALGNWFANDEKFNPTLPTGMEEFLSQFSEGDIVEALVNFDASTVATFISNDIELPPK